MRFSQASFWSVFTNSSTAFGTTLRNRPASAGTLTIKVALARARIALALSAFVFWAGSAD
jgi:hypothetical protein